MIVITITLVFGILLTEPTGCIEVRKFPAEFRFGSSSSSYQVEGAWNISDKSESIWDHAAHTPGKIFDATTGDVAADSYHQLHRDVEITTELGLDYYRFSISWSRLMPSGFPDKISEDGKQYYTELIEELLQNGVDPMVTIYHWELPQRLQELGGWANPLIVDWFEDYARVVFDLFADKVQLWITINEPLVMCAFGYHYFISPLLTPSPGIGDYLCTRHVLLAHARVWRMYDENYRSKYAGAIGLSNMVLMFESENDSEDDIELVEMVHQLYTGLYSQPIFAEEGGWPTIVEEYIADRSKEDGHFRSRLPVFTQKEIEYIRGTYDFYGLNFYMTKYVRHSNETRWPLLPEIRADIYDDPNWTTTASDIIRLNPVGIRKTLNFIKDRYNDPLIIITENGYPSEADVGLEDDDRVQFIKDYLDQVLNAIYLDGVNVTHYTYWSMIDSFEWISGYTTAMGLYEVNFSDPARQRTAKKSALLYKHITSSRALDLDYQPSELHNN